MYPTNLTPNLQPAKELVLLSKHINYAFRTIEYKVLFGNNSHVVTATTSFGRGEFLFEFEESFAKETDPEGLTVISRKVADLVNTFINQDMDDIKRRPL